MFWFYHEYLDEARRFRIHRFECDSEKDARKHHKQACEFRWVTQHVEPSVSSLFAKTETGSRAIVQGHRPGQPYHTDFQPVPAPDAVRKMFENVRIGGNPDDL